MFFLFVLFFLRIGHNEFHGFLTTTVNTNFIVTDNGLIHGLQKVGLGFKELDIMHGRVNFPCFHGPIATFTGPFGRIGFMVSDPSNVQFRNTIKGQFRRFASQDIGHTGQQVRRGHGGKVFVKAKERDIFGGFRPTILNQGLLKLDDTLRGADGIVVEFGVGQDLSKGRLHVFVISGIQQELDASLLDEGCQGGDELDNKGALRPGATDGNEQAQGFAGLTPLDASLTIGGNILDQVGRTPMSGTVQFPLGNAHGQKGLIIDGALHTIQGIGHGQEPLGEIVHDQIAHIGKAGGRGRQGTQLMRGNDTGILGIGRQEGLQMRRRQTGRSQGIGIARQHHVAPQSFHRSTPFRSQSTKFAIQIIGTGNQGRFGGIQTEQIMKDCRVAQFQGPRAGRIGNAMMTKAHANRGHNNGNLLVVVVVVVVVVRQDLVHAGNIAKRGLIGSRLVRYHQAGNMSGLVRFQGHRIGPRHAIAELHLVGTHNLEVIDRCLATDFIGLHKGINVTKCTRVVDQMLVHLFGPHMQSIGNKVIHNQNESTQDRGHPTQGGLPFRRKIHGECHCIVMILLLLWTKGYLSLPLARDVLSLPQKESTTEACQNFVQSVTLCYEE